MSEWTRYGLRVSDKTLSNWIITASYDWLFPIYELLRHKLVQNKVLHADETPYQILNRMDGKQPPLKQGFGYFERSKMLNILWRITMPI